MELLTDAKAKYTKNPTFVPTQFATACYKSWRVLSHHVYVLRSMYQVIHPELHATYLQLSTLTIHTCIPNLRLSKLMFLMLMKP